jgi:hypothetical protein
VLREGGSFGVSLMAASRAVVAGAACLPSMDSIIKNHSQSVTVTLFSLQAIVRNPNAHNETHMMI